VLGFPNSQFFLTVSAFGESNASASNLRAYGSSKRRVILQEDLSFIQRENSEQMFSHRDDLAIFFLPGRLDPVVCQKVSPKYKPSMFPCLQSPSSPSLFVERSFLDDSTLNVLRDDIGLEIIHDFLF
jgi:hypothetical protein